MPLAQLRVEISALPSIPLGFVFFFWSNPACSSGGLQNAYRAKPTGTTVSGHPEVCQSLKELSVLGCALRKSEPPRTTQTTSMLTKAGPQLLPLDLALISPPPPRLVDLQLNCPPGLVLGPLSLCLGTTGEEHPLPSAQTVLGSTDGCSTLDKHHPRGWESWGSRSSSFACRGATARLLPAAPTSSLAERGLRRGSAARWRGQGRTRKEVLWSRETSCLTR